MYLALASDSLDAYHTDNDDWEPKLYKYQQEGANVLFFTFINPETMIVPRSFQKLAKSRGTGTDGAVPEDTGVLILIRSWKASPKMAFLQSSCLPSAVSSTASG